MVVSQNSWRRQEVSLWAPRGGGDCSMYLIIVHSNCSSLTVLICLHKIPGLQSFACGCLRLPGEKSEGRENTLAALLWAVSIDNQHSGLFLESFLPSPELRLPWWSHESGPGSWQPLSLSILPNYSPAQPFFINLVFCKWLAHHELIKFQMFSRLLDPSLLATPLSLLLFCLLLSLRCLGKMITLGSSCALSPCHVLVQ